METKLTRRIRIRQARRERYNRIKSLFLRQAKKTLSLFLIMALLTSFVGNPAADAFFTSKTGESEPIKLVVEKDCTSKISCIIRLIFFFCLISKLSKNLCSVQSTSFSSGDPDGDEQLMSLQGLEQSEAPTDCWPECTELPVEIFLEDEKLIEDIYIPSVKLYHGENSIAPLRGELKGEKMVVFYDLETVLDWIIQAEGEFEEIAFLVKGEGYQDGVDHFEFSAPAQIIMEDNHMQQGEADDDLIKEKEKPPSDSSSGQDEKEVEEEQQDPDEEELRPGKSVEIKSVDEVHSPLEIPDEKPLYVSYEAVVFDYCGEEVEKLEEELIWDFIVEEDETDKDDAKDESDEDYGLALSEDGELKITPEAEPGEITLTVSLIGDVCDEPSLEAQMPVVLVPACDEDDQDGAEDSIKKVKEEGEERELNIDSHSNFEAEFEAHESEKDNKEPETSSLEIDDLEVIKPEGPFIVPRAKKAEGSYFNNYILKTFANCDRGNLLQVDEVTWSLKGDEPGIYISEEGVLSVGEKASEGDLCLEFSLPDDPDNRMEIEIELEIQPEEEEELLPPEEVPIKKDDELKEVEGGAEEDDPEENADDKEDEKEERAEKGEEEDKGGDKTSKE